MSFFAKLISFLFHPGFMPLIGFAIVLNLDTYLKYTVQPQAKTFLYGILVVNTIVFPFLVLLLLKARGAIQSFQLEKRSDRIIPFGVSLIFYSFTYSVMKKMGLPPIVLSMFFGMLMSLLVLFASTFFTKVSAHMIGVFGVLACVLVLYTKFSANFGTEIMILTLVAGLVGSSRLYLKAHKPSEIYVGSFIGLTIVFCTTAFSLMI